MTAKHIELGNKGELHAKEYILSLGYKILESNWRFSRAEIDLIAMDGEDLVFIEVKTRSNNYFGNPEDFVGNKKKRLIMDAAANYMERIGYEWTVRFDIVALVVERDTFRLEHFKDAFFSGEV